MQYFTRVSLIGIIFIKMLIKFMKMLSEGWLPKLSDNIGAINATFKVSKIPTKAAKIIKNEN
jgi:hypothetical protein